MARLRLQVGQAAPVVAALIKGTDKETVVSELYGGSGGQQASTDDVYTAIGNASRPSASPPISFCGSPFQSNHRNACLQMTGCT